MKRNEIPDEPVGVVEDKENEFKIASIGVQLIGVKDRSKRQETETKERSSLVSSLLNYTRME